MFWIIPLAGAAAALFLSGCSSSDNPDSGSDSGPSDSSSPNYELISMSSNGVVGDRGSRRPSINRDGRLVSFTSYATNLTPGDTNEIQDIFVRDRSSNVTQRISVMPNGGQSNSYSWNSVISADGRFIAFTSRSSNLVTSVNTSNFENIFIRNLITGANELISVGVGNQPASVSVGTPFSNNPSTSADGRFVAFASNAGNLVLNDLNNGADIFVRDRQNGMTELITVGADGNSSNGNSYTPAISADGRFVAFQSNATNLVPGYGDIGLAIFLRDRQTGSNELISVGPGGVPSNSLSESPVISADGRFVAFSSSASNLITNDMNSGSDIFLRDRQTGITELISVIPDYDPIIYYVNTEPSISADGRFVAFHSQASVASVPRFSEIFVRDRQMGITRRVTVGSNTLSSAPSISADGRFLTFSSYNSFGHSMDANRTEDVFLVGLDYFFSH